MSYKTRHASWKEVGGFERAIQALNDASNRNVWWQMAGINAVDGRIFWSFDESGVTIYFREKIDGKATQA